MQTTISASHNQLQTIKELAVEVLNSESNEGCEDGYTVVAQPKIMQLLDNIRSIDVIDKAAALAATQQSLADAMEHAEKLHRRIAMAGMFMRELLESVETLTGVAEEYGPRTLADLMYLHGAILNNSFIEHIPGESSVFNIAHQLPSGGHWVKFIRKD